jgi:hypothetical protein
MDAPVTASAMRPVSIALAAMLAVTLGSSPTASTVYNPGDIAPQFCVAVMSVSNAAAVGEQGAAKKPHTASAMNVEHARGDQGAVEVVCHDPASPSTSNLTLPLMMFVVDSSLSADVNLFTSNMITSTTSVDAFLVDAAATTTATALFIARDDPADATAASVAINARLALQPVAVRDALAGRLLFATVAMSNVVGLSDLADQFPAAVNAVSVDVPGGRPPLNVSRFDCRYTACPWPDETETVQLVATTSRGGCDVNTTSANATGRWVVALVDPSSNASCTVDQVAGNAAKVGAAGLLVVSPPGPVPETGAADISVSSVRHADGMAIIDAVNGASAGWLNATLFPRGSPASLLAIDGDGRVAEVGWPKYSTLQMLSWQAAYFDFQTELRQNLSKPALVVPVMSTARLGKSSSVVTIQLPPLDLLSSFGHMEIDFSLNCLGSRDTDCPIWDHCITLTATCHDPADSRVAPSSATAAATAMLAAAALRGKNEHFGTADARGVGTSGSDPVWLGSGEAGGTVNEMGRWVTPFRRRGGRWLTPATQLLPRLNTTNCTFALASPGDDWIADVSLRFSNHKSEQHTR